MSIDLNTEAKILDTLEAMPPIERTPDDFEINDIEAVRSQLGLVVQYAASVETEVEASGEVAEDVMPWIDGNMRRFFDIWYPHEAGHGSSQLALLERLDLPAISSFDNKTNIKLKAAGKISSLTPWSRDFAETFIMAYMALGEQETIDAYTAMARQFTALGEMDLARFYGGMANQERPHRDFQKTRSMGAYANLHPYLQQKVGETLEARYLPVGVVDMVSDRAVAFGGLLRTLTQDEGVELASKMTKLTSEMMPSAGSDFITDMYEALTTLWDAHDGYIAGLERDSLK